MKNTSKRKCSKDYQEGYLEGYQAAKDDVIAGIKILAFLILTSGTMFLGAVINCLPLTIIALVIFLVGYFCAFS